MRERSVKRWESPDYPQYHAPDDAWELLDDARARQLEVVGFALGKVRETEAVAGNPPHAVRLVLWRDQAAYDGDHPDDPGSFRVANANVRAVYDRLTELGYPVELEWS